MNFGPTEMLILLVIVLILFGAGKLPQVGRSLGTAISDFKESVSGKHDEKDDTTEEKDEKA